MKQVLQYRRSGATRVSTTKPGTKRVCSAPMSRAASHTRSLEAAMKMSLKRLAMNYT